MSYTDTIHALESFCRNSSTFPDIWEGNNGRYKWNLGREKHGIVNGVVRKLAGTNGNGEDVWAVAGSLKIGPKGEILRFTGLAKKHQKLITNLSTVVNTEQEKKVATEEHE